MSPRESDQSILDAVVNFVLSYPNSSLEVFHDNVKNWGSEWCEVQSTHLPAVDFLSADLSSSFVQINSLLELFEQHKGRLRWEQSYKTEDGAVGDDMLSGYGFAEIIGKRGPFVSTKVRCGIGVWGPHINYPKHFHKAEEIYLVMAGSALFTLGSHSEQKKVSGDVIYVNSMLPHGFRTTNDTLSVLYLWQSGDLREKSTFCRI